MVGFMGIGIGIGTGTSRGNKNTKRKDSDAIDQFSHDFSDFSLSSPARKIRRLEADLPPIMEEEEPEISPPPPFFIESLNNNNNTESDSDSDNDSVEGDRKAIVLFKPLKSSFFNASPSNISLSVDSNLISGFKEGFVRLSSKQQEKPIEEDKRKQCSLAVVPWAPLASHLIPPPTMTSTEQPLDSMDTEVDLMDTEADSMEIEEIIENNTTRAIELEQQGSDDGYEGLAQQWQQQHCMVPQPHHSTSTPISWFSATQHRY